MDKELSKKELIKLYETLPETTLRKLGVYGKAKEVYEEKQKLEKLKQERMDRAIALVKEAQELVGIYKYKLIVTHKGEIKIQDQKGRKINQRKERQKGGQKLKKGIKTPQIHYRISILQALTELGGRGKVKQVLEKVYEIMKDKLNSYDLERTSSGALRWSNTAQWERNEMVKEGLLKEDSPMGIWEISEKGKRYLLEEHLNGEV